MIRQEFDRLADGNARNSTYRLCVCGTIFD